MTISKTSCLHIRLCAQAGVKMEQVKTSLTLIYPQTAHDYEYYRASTVAWFMVAEVKAKLERVLGIVH